MQMNMEIKYYISPTKGENWLFDIPPARGRWGGGEISLSAAGSAAAAHKLWQSDKDYAPSYKL